MPLPVVEAVAVTVARARLLSGSASRGLRAIAAGVAHGVVVWGLVALCLACGAARDGHHVPMATEHAAKPDRGIQPIRSRPSADPATERDGPALTEAAARVLLAERFRAAGYRVRYDVHVARDDAFAVTVDGYDPARRVGFEYVAEAEAGADLDPAERTALARDPAQRILIIDPAGAAGAARTARTADEIRALADRFLQALETPGPGASR